MGDKLQSVAKNALDSVQKVYFDGLEEIEKAKVRGKGQVYQESFKWMIETYQGDLKFVRIDQFLRMLRGKCNIEKPENVVNNGSKRWIPE